MKLEAVILAAGSGSRMVELTRGRPKCLLPVGNQNLIWFAITGLRLVGISRIIILVPDIHETDIKQYCHKKFNSFKNLALEFVTVPTKADCGTAESIYEIRDKIREDFIVHSCDSIVPPKVLSALVNHYRLYDPMLTMLLADNAKHFLPRPVPGRREKEQYMRDLIGVEPLDKLDLTADDEISSNKVVFIHSERDLKHNLRIRNKELALHPSLEVYSKFLDTHIYIFKRQLFEFMGHNKDKAVLKGEMIPLLIAKQFSSSSQKESQGLEDDEVNETRRPMDYEMELKERLESFDPKNLAQETYLNRRPHLPRPSACHALIVKNVAAFRVNTVGSYLDANREAKTILQQFGIEDLQVMKECLIGENLKVGKNCLIKKGSVGSNCKIGDKVKLLDCAIMDNVEIESNTTLNECIVGSYSRIGTKCDLKSCIIGYRQVVPDGRKANSEVIIDDGYVIDLSDPIVAEE